MTAPLPSVNPPTEQLDLLSSGDGQDRRRAAPLRVPLLYSDPRLGHRRGGVLFVGPDEPYLAYVADVLPSLGEGGVQTCTLRDLAHEGAEAAVGLFARIHDSEGNPIELWEPPTEG